MQHCPWSHPCPTHHFSTPPPLEMRCGERPKKMGPVMYIGGDIHFRSSSCFKHSGHQNLQSFTLSNHNQCFSGSVFVGQQSSPPFRAPKPPALPPQHGLLLGPKWHPTPATTFDHPTSLPANLRCPKGSVGAVD